MLTASSTKSSINHIMILPEQRNSDAPYSSLSVSFVDHTTKKPVQLASLFLSKMRRTHRQQLVASRRATRTRSRLLPSTTSNASPLVPFFLMMMTILFTIPQEAHAAHSTRRRAVVGRRENRYDRSVTTLDPSGRLLQVEYGLTAASRGTTGAACLVRNETIYVVTEHSSAAATSSSSSNNKLHKLHEHVWMATAGLAGDARALSGYLRQVCQHWDQQYAVDITVQQLAQQTAELQHELTVATGRRPLGLTALLIGFDSRSQQQQQQPRIMRCSAGGIQEDCLFCAAGREHEAVQNCIAKCYDKLQSCSSAGEAVELLVEAVREGLGQQGTSGHAATETPLKLDVWVFRKSGDASTLKPVCLTGVSDSESLAKARSFLASQDNTETPS